MGVLQQQTLFGFKSQHNQNYKFLVGIGLSKDILSRSCPYFPQETVIECSLK